MNENEYQEFIEDHFNSYRELCRSRGKKNHNGQMLLNDAEWRDVISLRIIYDFVNLNKEGMPEYYAWYRKIFKDFYKHIIVDARGTAEGRKTNIRYRDDEGEDQTDYYISRLLTMTLKHEVVRCFFEKNPDQFKIIYKHFSKQDLKEISEKYKKFYDRVVNPYKKTMAQMLFSKDDQAHAKRPTIQNLLPP